MSEGRDGTGRGEGAGPALRRLSGSAAPAPCHNGPCGGAGVGRPGVLSAGEGGFPLSTNFYL